MEFLVNGTGMTLFGEEVGKGILHEKVKDKDY